MGWYPKLNGIPIGPLGNGEFALRTSRHPFFINGSHNHPGAVGLSQLQNLEEAFITIFVVGGIQDALSASHLEASLHFLPLGGVEHEGQVHIGDEPAHQGTHVGFAITADVVDVDIENVGIFFDLAPGYGDQAIPILIIEQLPYFFGATGIQPFPNDQKGVVLVVGGGAVDRSCGWFQLQQRAGQLLLWSAHLAGCWLQLF